MSDNDEEDDREPATSGHASAISPAARSQLEAIRDEWLAPLVERIQGQAERIGRLEAERDHLQAEVDRLRAAQEAAVAAPEPQHGALPAETAPDTSAPWWRFWERWG